VWGYGPSYLVSAGVELLAVPFILLARRERASSDLADDEATSGPDAAPAPAAPAEGVPAAAA
jgi:hypothetical protein